MTLSIQSAVDKAATRILKKAGVCSNAPTEQRDREGHRRQVMSEQAKQQALERQEERKQRRAEGHIVTAVDEYNTSKVCPRCITDRRTSYLQYLRCPPAASRHTGHATLDKDGNEEINVSPSAMCAKCIFHRDGVAAQSQALISASMLEHGQCRKPFIRPSRQLKPNTHPRQTCSILNLNSIFESQLIVPGVVE
ncbi:hypothetical protein VTP01DRAFT_4413 [Rhizomucor pusillus]|uniref:uncharacterized protein n=1 Tax=Rhizomucor pusillus TaxID=4840 RepID=UPI0037438F9A